MARPIEIAAYVLASVIALGGGYVAAEMLLGGDAPQARPASERGERPAAAVPAEGVEVRNSRYGFNFRHPEGWRASPVNHPNIVVAVARPDGVLCMVTVNERDLPSDASGKPEQLSRMLSGVSPSQITQAVPAGAKVSAFEKSTLGGQEARSFMLEASAPPLGALKIRGHATLRRFGAIVLMCMASERLLGASDVKAAFKLVHTSFRFD